MTIKEVVSALKKAGLEAKHNKANWGDWIVFGGKETVVSIESLHGGLTTAATVEASEGEDELEEKIVGVFRKMGWEGEDEDGRYPL
ncbi:MAG: hypothetical protein AAGC74_11290 [Verrucomicrobiota bacterium]